MQLVLDRLSFISPANVLGLPSVAVPTGVCDGLPTGVQVYAERWRDDLALEGARELVLEVDFGENAHVNDWANWGSAMFLR